MVKLRWFLNRGAAGITTAAGTGIVVLFASSIYDLLTSSDARASLVSTPAIAYAYLALIGALYGIMFGSIPGVIVMCFSRARFDPWRATPILLLGTILGGSAALAIAKIIAQYSTIDGTPFFVLITVCATVGGGIASFFLRGDRFAIAPQDDTAI